MNIEEWNAANPESEWEMVTRVEADKSDARVQYADFLACFYEEYAGSDRGLKGAYNYYWLKRPRKRKLTEEERAARHAELDKELDKVEVEE